MSPGQPLLHGTERNYAKGCRCADCTLYHSDFLEGRVPSVPSIVDCAPWRVILADVARRMETDPVRLVQGCGLSRRIAVGITSGRYRHVTSYTDARLRKLLLLLPTEEVISTDQTATPWPASRRPNDATEVQP